MQMNAGLLAESERFEEPRGGGEPIRVLRDPNGSKNREEEENPSGFFEIRTVRRTARRRRTHQGSSRSERFEEPRGEGEPIRKIMNVYLLQ
jgi:hypothetical protein